LPATRKSTLRHTCRATEEHAIRIQHRLRLRISICISTQLPPRELLRQLRRAFRRLLLVFLGIRSFAVQKKSCPEFGGPPAPTPATGVKVFSEAAPRLSAAAAARWGCGSDG
jgi:hypothetical protein